MTPDPNTIAAAETARELSSRNITLSQVDGILEIRHEPHVSWPFAVRAINAYVELNRTLDRIKVYPNPLLGIFFSMPGSIAFGLTARYLGVGTGVGGDIYRVSDTESLWVDGCPALAQLVVHVINRASQAEAEAATAQLIAEREAGERVAELIKGWSAEDVAALQLASSTHKSWGIATTLAAAGKDKLS